MSLSLSTTVVLNMAAPIIGKVVKEIVESKFTEEALEDARQYIIASVFAITGKTTFALDDELAEMVIKDVSKPEIYQEYGDKFLDAIELVVAHTETKWDDVIVLPTVGVVRDVAGIPDGSD
jgi:hypothetical protein